MQALEKAWRRWFITWRDYAFALVENTQSEDGDDVLQDAVVRTILARPVLRTEHDAHYYMLAAVRTTAIHLFNVQSRRQNAGLFGFGRDELFASDPLEMLLEQEAEERKEGLTQKAVNAMNELDEGRRQILELLVLREPPLTLREVAALQGLPLTTVHYRLKQTLRQLAREVGE